MINPKRSELSAEKLQEILTKQKGLCALTGEKLTCIIGKGIYPTNASIDRIDAGGPYSVQNIQLVCTAVNSFRRDLTVDDYINWCRKVVAFADR